jgi:hypothetical protein
MRWMLITFESLATGLFVVVVALVVFYIGLGILFRSVFGQPSDGAVALDVPGLLGPHWMEITIGTLTGIFLLGTRLGFWFFSQRVHR